MRVIETKVYKFNELSKSSQDAAIEKHREWQYSNGEYLHFFSENCNIYLTENTPFENTQLSYSLSHCQGDGLSFSAEYDTTKLEALLNEKLGANKTKCADILARNIDVILKGNTGRYCFAAKSQVDVYLEPYDSSVECTDNIDEFIADEILPIIEQQYMDACEELEKRGYADIDYQNSDEYIKETIISNEYEFEEDGTEV